MIGDSGARREFDTGAVRDIQEGKGRCDLLPLSVVYVMCNRAASLVPQSGNVLAHIDMYQKYGEIGYLRQAIESFVSISNWDGLIDMFLDVSIHFEEGAAKYGEYNWQKGIPSHCYIDSAVRHYLKWLRGDDDEPHDRAFIWNILCCIWTCIHKPDLNDYPRKVEEVKEDE